VTTGGHCMESGLGLLTSWEWQSFSLPPKKKEESTHQTFSKFELHMTLPNRCSSFYSPIKQFALLFCALHGCFPQKTSMDSCSDVLCRKQKLSHAVPHEIQIHQKGRRLVFIL